MKLYRVHHQTDYAYGAAVSISHNVARLLPRERAGQDPRRSELHIQPTPSTLSWFRDYFGNPCVFFVIEEPHESLGVHVESRVALGERPAPDATRSPAWEEAASRVRSAGTDADLEALEFVFDSPLVPRSEVLADFGRSSFPAGRPLLAGARDLCGRIHREFRYDPEATTLATPVHDALAGRRGVCQDYAHVMLGALRSLGLPARYVSGYIESAPPKAPKRGRGSGDPRLVGSEASHAWVAVYCPANGWVDLDPTNDLVPSDRHVTVAWGRDYDDVSPIQGVTLGGGLQTVSVGVEMRRIEGDA